MYRGLRQENKDLKSTLEEVKQEANFALDRFWVDFDVYVVNYAHATVLRLVKPRGYHSSMHTFHILRVLADQAIYTLRIEFDEHKKPLGRGATAVVLHATVYGQGVAVKKVSARSIEDIERGAESLFHELEKVAPLEHRNVIEALGGCEFSPVTSRHPLPA